MNEELESNEQLVAGNNPFTSSARSQMATVQVEQERAVAEVQAAIILARRFPRDPVQSMDKILNSCTRPGLAESALYSYSRGGTDITGPSIRLAEAMAQAWGNLSYGIRELEQRDGESTVEAFAWDLETNVRQTKIFQVSHERHSKRGTTKLTDPRDIYETIANNAARRLRSCLLGILPGDVTEEAVKQCEVTMRSNADTSPEAIQKMLKAFADNFGVSKEQIEKRIQRRVDSIQPAQVISLRKIFASLKDGMSNADDWFEGGTEKKEFIKKPAKQEPSDAEVQQQPAQNGQDAQRMSLVDEINEKADAAGMSVKTIKAWAHKEGLVQDATMVLGKYPTESLEAILARWEEISK